MSLLLLTTGFETDLGLIKRLGRAAVLVAAASLVLPFVLGLGLGFVLPEVFIGPQGDRLTFALFVAAALSISSLPVIAKILGGLGLLRRNFGQITLAAGMAAGLDRREGFALGAGLNARGALEIVVATIGLSLGVLDEASSMVDAVREQLKLGFGVVGAATSNSRTDHTLLGESIDELLRMVSVPLVIVRPAPDPESRLPGAFSRALVPISGNRASRAAQEVAFNISRALGTRIVLAHAVEPVRAMFGSSGRGGAPRLIRHSGDSRCPGAVSDAAHRQRTSWRPRIQGSSGDRNTVVCRASRPSPGTMRSNRVDRLEHRLGP